MKVITAPTGLRLATALLFLCVPLAAFETVIVSRAPWWNLPFKTIGAWCAAVFLICAPLAAWLSGARKWALQLSLAFMSLWSVLSAWVAIRMRMPALGFFTILLLVFFSGMLLWLRREIGRSFLDPRMSWYQGLPRPIPGLSCRIGKTEWRVCRLDKEGAFLYSENNRSEGSPTKAFEASELEFRFREHQVKCPGMPMSVLDRNQGAGFQFRGLTGDSRKELGDFIETLQGEGYVG